MKQPNPTATPTLHTHMPMQTFIFTNHFILVRIVVDLESIPGTLDTKQEYILDGKSFHQKAPLKHTFTHTDKNITNIPTSLFLGGGKKQENLEKTYVDL